MTYKLFYNFINFIFTDIINYNLLLNSKRFYKYYLYIFFNIHNNNNYINIINSYNIFL